MQLISGDAGRNLNLWTSTQN